MKRALRIVGLAVAAAAVAIQLVPVRRSNPPVEADLEAPPAAEAALRRACYDCHSHETRWPWYAYVAPASWLVARDVEEARREMNFSAWGSYSPKKQAGKAREAWKEVSEGKMPLRMYVLAHPDARLSAADLDVIRAWASEGADAGETD